MLESPVAIKPNRIDLNGKKKISLQFKLYRNCLGGRMWCALTVNMHRKPDPFYSLNKCTWLCYPKLEIWVNNFPCYVVLFGRPRFVYFSRILCVQFTQIHDDVFHASLLDAMCSSDDKLPRDQYTTALVFSDAYVRLPWKCSKRCRPTPNNSLLNSIVSRSWNPTFELILKHAAEKFSQQLCTFAKCQL